MNKNLHKKVISKTHTGFAVCATCGPTIGIIEIPIIRVAVETITCQTCGSTDTWPKRMIVPRQRRASTQPRPKSQYRGVSSDGNGRWKVQYGKYHLGTSPTEEEAAEVYNQFAYQRAGKKAILNVIVRRKEPE